MRVDKPLDCLPGSRIGATAPNLCASAATAVLTTPGVLGLGVPAAQDLSEASEGRCDIPDEHAGANSTT